MADRHKFKYDMYTNQFPMAPGGSFPSFGSSSSMIKVNPTPELQEVYNNMRDVEKDVAAEKAEFEKQLQLRRGHGDLLEPPSPQGTEMVRSASGTSVAHSVTSALGAVRLTDDHNRVNKKKGQARRSGPLAQDKKARTAFMRKLGACHICKDRKVKCDNHYDLSLFEQRYQASVAARQRPVNNLTPVSPVANSTAFPSRPGPYADPNPFNTTLRPFYDPQVFNQSLLGIESNPAVASNPAIVPVPDQTSFFEQAGPEIDNLLTLSRSQQRPTLSLSPVATPPPLMGYTRSASSTLFSSDRSYNQIFQDAKTDDLCIHIGRCINSDPLNEQWQCTYGSDDTDSLSSTDGEVCNRQYPSLANLKFHFYNDHTPFHKDELWYKCMSCRAMSPWLEGKCIQTECRNQFLNQSDWEKWCFAYVSSTPSIASAPAIRVTDQDYLWPKWQPGPPSVDNHFQGFGGLGSTGTSGGSGIWPNSSGGGGYGNGYGFRQNQQKFQLPDSFKSCPLRGKKDGAVVMSKSSKSVFHDGILGDNFVLPCILAVALVCLAWKESSMSAGGFWMSPARALAKVVNAVTDHVSECAVVCMLTGLVGMWLFNHVRYRLSHRRDASSRGRCLMMRDVLGIPPDGVDDVPEDQDIGLVEMRHAPEFDVLTLGFAR